MMEFQLERLFQKKRDAGIKVSARWIMNQALHLAKQLYPAVKFVASAGWLRRFAHRNKIVPRVKSNAKVHSVAARVPLCQQWHANFRAFLARADIPNTISQFNPKWGRFPPELRFNVDQVPFSFVVDQSRTWAKKGQTGVWIAEPGNGAWSKRQATLILLVCADARVKCRPAIIFRGQGLRISALEREQWSKDIDVYWQKNAWATEEIMIKWVKRTWSASLGDKDERRRALLLCDNLHAQTTPAFRKACDEEGATVWYYPPNCTDLLQVIDAGHGRDVKRYAGEEYADWCSDDGTLESWEDGSLDAAARRVLMTQWAVTGIRRAQTSTDEKLVRFVRTYFLKTGSLMTIDGSDDELVKPQGCKEYTFNIAPNANSNELVSCVHALHANSVCRHWNRRQMRKRRR